MKKARLIKSGEFVQASEAKYDDRPGIYQYQAHENPAQKALRFD
ncbi:hypothetical protein [Dendronalium sp. ChiSLP03b]|nr:hypothetical protein [Dendronalium sp. ChiSLP03b]MDZ8207877.1 hypothetical protein [Dendronalium sp. ChiSLP03b]